MNLGLGDAEALSRALVDAVRVGRDLGDESGALKNFAAERWGRGLVVGGSCDVLGKVYGDGDGDGLGGGGARVARWVGGVGMRVLDGWESGKRWVMKQAEG